MGGPYSNSVVGSACRIYKNEFDDVIAIDDLSVVEISRTKRANGTYFVSTALKHKRTTANIGTDPSDRVVFKIEMIGDYVELDLVNNYATWLIEQASVKISLAHLAQIGGSV